MSLDRKSYMIPMFFRKDVLEEFRNVEWSTDYLGVIKDKGMGLPFGITPKGYVSIWLGDFIGVDADTRVLFIPYYVETDDLGKHFVRSQLMAEFVKKEDPN